MSTLYTQQLEVYSRQGANKDPRVAIIDDLWQLILSKFYIEQDYLVVGIDANEDSTNQENPSILDMFSSLGLHDALEFLNGEPPTHYH